MGYSVGIIGSGMMGTQLTEYLLSKGINVILKTRFASSTRCIYSKIKRQLEKYNDKKTVDLMINSLEITDDYNSLLDCSLIIESAKEDFDVKKDIFKNISMILPKSTVITTNTSSLSIEKLSQYVQNPSRFVGCHFFNPVHKMKLVEIIKCSKTDEKTELFIKKICTDLNKTTVILNDSPGFIVNRLLLPQINEAVHMIDTGISSAEEIDNAVILGLNHPMGPLTLADYIGIDTCVAILYTLYEETKKEQYIPSQGLLDMLNNGHLGRKTKIGFYTYN